MKNFAAWTQLGSLEEFYQRLLGYTWLQQSYLHLIGAYFKFLLKKKIALVQGITWVLEVKGLISLR